VTPSDTTKEVLLDNIKRRLTPQAVKIRAGKIMSTVDIVIMRSMSAVIFTEKCLSSNHARAMCAQYNIM
jgi:hypothetical protein